jgi:hypothetical protein
MRWLSMCLLALVLSGCGAQKVQVHEDEFKMASASVGIVNHTDKYVYSASVNGAGGSNMSEYGAGGASVCCAMIPKKWYPGLTGPDGHPKLLHCWPVKLLQAGRGDYAGSEVMIRRAAASLSL